MPPAAAIAAAVRQIIAELVEQRLAPEVAAARGVQRLTALLDSDELPSERIRRENEAALIEMAALGNGRDAAMLVARRWTRDPHGREMLAQRFRRFRRER